MRQASVSGCVVVEAANTTDEIPWLLQLSDQSPLIHGVVGWLDWDQPGIRATLDTYRTHPRFVGARLNWFGDNWSDNAQVRSNLTVFDAFGLTCDVLTRPELIPDLIALIRDYPNTRFVINHLAGSGLTPDGASAWKAAMTPLQSQPNVYLKFSGFLSQLPVTDTDQTMIADYLDAALDILGEHRLLFASNYPISLRVTPDYATPLAVLQPILAQHHHHTQQNILHNNALDAYRLVMD